ncbi:hypothetical protein SEPCBS57363_001019 [Sporothrix epigloea]|uniref:Uncharacterized protein n=1 Tax=Sporothrix epigloea TaxID=1892477 RepID=A0ABP0DBP9_9PEZI
MPVDTQLVAPAMSASSSRASNLSDLWSAESSRRGSNASSIYPPSTSDSDTSLLYEKQIPLLTTGGVPMTASTSEGGHRLTHTAQPTPTPLRRPLKFTTDPLERFYPKPEMTIDLGAALAREPLKWSLGHWKKNARDVATPALTHEASKQRFEDAKNELRRAQRDMAFKPSR